MPISITTIVIIISIILLVCWHISTDTTQCTLTQPSYNTQTKPETFCCGAKPAHIVLYYASWCHVCRGMKPEWDKFSKRVIPGLEISSIRCEGGNETTCFQKNITQYPTIILSLPSGREIEFTENRTDEALYAFVKRHLNSN